MIAELEKLLGGRALSWEACFRKPPEDGNGLCPAVCHLSLTFAQGVSEQEADALMKEVFALRVPGYLLGSFDSKRELFGKRVRVQAKMEWYAEASGKSNPFYHEGS